MKCKIILGLFVFFLFNVSFAKVVDCPPLALGNVKYITHHNYLKAYDITTDRTLWERKIFIEEFVDDYDISLEDDSQLNIACIQSSNLNTIVIEDGRNRKFYVDIKTGKVVYKTKNNKIVTGNDISYVNHINQTLKSRLGRLYFLPFSVFIIAFLFLMYKLIIGKFKFRNNKIS